MQKAVFLDRDGTINVDRGYVYRIEDFEFIEKVPEAIMEMKRFGYLVIVLSNQSGVARGYYTEDDVVKLHAHINDRRILFLPPPSGGDSRTVSPAMRMQKACYRNAAAGCSGF